MWCLRYPQSLKTRIGPDGCVATIGAYDGIHIGHQALLSRTRKLADQLGLPAVVMSFEPLPKEFFLKDSAPARITRFAERARLLRSAGMDGFFCVRFDERLSGITPDDFIRVYLHEGLNVRHLVIGDDFRFGHRASGGVAELLAAGERDGFVVTQLGSIDCGELRASSTRVRAVLAKGDLRAAGALLGRPFMLSGRVVHGQQLGRTLGFPTANIRLKRRVSPVSGVFAVRVAGIADAPMPGVASIGTRPTVNGAGVLLEVFVFDFNGDLYGKMLDVELVAKLRDEEKFDSLDEMTVQMHRDLAIARELLIGGSLASGLPSRGDDTSAQVD